MHKYFDFTKIYEAEQSGIPLDPTGMGLPAAGQAATPDEEKLKDFGALAADNLIEIVLTDEDRKNLESGESIIKTDAQWKKKKGDQTDGIINIKSIIINTKNDTAKNDKDSLIFNIDDPATPEGVTRRILDNFSQPETSEHIEVLKGLAQDGTDVPNITVKFLRSTEPSTNVGAKEAIPASDTQVASGAVVPEPAMGEIAAESRSIMSFDQFVNEGKMNWIDDVIKSMDKGALKKKMGGKVTKEKIAKSEKALAKKDKDKKKPGLQLDAKDAKSHKRNVLAKNLLNAQKGKK
jgi:hypothetical protein